MPISVSLEAEKTLEGGTLAANQFSFDLKSVDGETETVVETKKNGADGKVKFTDIEFTTDGTYKYKVSEVAGNEAGITYDDNVYTITYIVTKTKGKLSVQTSMVDKDKKTVAALEFKNTKTTVEDKGSLKIEKTIKGSVTPEEAAGLLVFTITGPEYPNGQTFTIKKGDGTTAFKYDEAGKKYILELQTIKAGK